MWIMFWNGRFFEKIILKEIIKFIETEGISYVKFDPSYSKPVVNIFVFTKNIDFSGNSKYLVVKEIKNTKAIYTNY